MTNLKAQTQGETIANVQFLNCEPAVQSKKQSKNKTGRQVETENERGGQKERKGVTPADKLQGIEMKIKY